MSITAQALADHPGDGETRICAQMTEMEELLEMVGILTSIYALLSKFIINVKFLKIRLNDAHLKR